LKASSAADSAAAAVGLGAEAALEAEAAAGLCVVARDWDSGALGFISQALSGWPSDCAKALEAASTVAAAKISLVVNFMMFS
jgi:hypothetical protein